MLAIGALRRAAGAEHDHQHTGAFVPACGNFSHAAGPTEASVQADVAIYAEGIVRTHSGTHTQALAYEGAIPSLEQVVFGVHWSPSPYGAHAADLDARCVMYDGQDRPLETVHGGRPRSANDSVVHTGDSPNGANYWDDERIYVFPEALPEHVRRLAFVVVCTNGRAFHQVPGATCHVTDHASGHEWLRIDLTALRADSHRVATLERMSRGWSLAAG